MEDGKREWVVTLHARSSVRLRGDQILEILAGPESMVPLIAIRLRNAFSNVDGKLLVTGLLAEARGMASDESTAVAFLAPHAAPYLQVAATAANGAVDETGRLLVYAPPTDSDVGCFLEQRSCSPPLPAATVRSITADELGPLVDALVGHPDEERIQRAVAHYRYAVLALVPFNRVMSAEHLYMACENLGLVVFRRLCREAGLPVSDDGAGMGENKHQLALGAGFSPVGTTRQHLNDFDSYIRWGLIFDGDRELYKSLRSASDAFEHGFGGFGDVQAAAHASAERAFGCVRRAILREIGVPETSPLWGEKYEHPLEGWQPVLEINGTYTSVRLDDWPYFYGASLFPEIIAIEDIDDDQKRSVSFRGNASGASLLDGQELSVEATTWSVPLTPDRKVERIGEPEVIVTRGEARGE